MRPVRYRYSARRLYVAQVRVFGMWWTVAACTTREAIRTGSSTTRALAEHFRRRLLGSSGSDYSD